MKKIGFIDYFLSEWHANNLPAWIENACKRQGFEYRVAYAWAELDVSPYDGVTTDEWCAKYGAERCASIDELCKKSDYLIILSPDNPEKHLRYANAALKYGKPAYIDKTFAPDFETAKKIFRLAEKYNVPMFTASALGFADELNEYTLSVHSVITTGGGGSLERYCVHQLEMIVRLMGVGAKRVISLSAGGNASAGIDYGGGRAAVLNYSQSYNFSVSVRRKENEAAKYSVTTSDFFQNLTNNILELFNTGKPAFSKEHTLEVMGVRDALLKSQKIPYKWIKVKNQEAINDI